MQSQNLNLGFSAFPRLPCFQPSCSPQTAGCLTSRPLSMLLPQCRMPCPRRPLSIILPVPQTQATGPFLPKALLNLISHQNREVNHYVLTAHGWDWCSALCFSLPYIADFHDSPLNLSLQHPSPPHPAPSTSLSVRPPAGFHIAPLVHCTGPGPTGSK